VTEEQGAVRKPLIERVRERKVRHKQHGKLYRISFVVAAVAVIALGLVFIPLPGPGWLIVAVGLGMLALEFDRAERLLEIVLNRLERVGEQAASAGPLSKAIAIALFVLGTAATVAVIVLWDIPYLPG